MSALRVLLTVAVAAALLVGLLSFGYLLPWHREAPERADTFKVQRPPAEAPQEPASEAPPPTEGRPEVGLRCDPCLPEIRDKPGKGHGKAKEGKGDWKDWEEDWWKEIEEEMEQDWD